MPSIRIEINVQIEESLEWRSFPDFVSQIDPKKMTEMQIIEEFIKYMQHYYNDEPDLESVGEMILDRIKDPKVKPRITLSLLETHK